MQYLKFADNVSDSTKFQIREGSELDVIIKVCSEEASPLRIGVCCLTDPKELNDGTLIPLTDKLVVRYFGAHNRDTMLNYVREFCCGAMTTKLDVDGTIWIDKGKKHKFDCIPSSDVEDMLKKDHPDMFHMFIMDNEDRRRDVYGLFLFNIHNSINVHRMSYFVESYAQKGKPFPKVDFASVPLIGPAAFYVLKELKYLT